jgi:basic membrane protein A
MVGNAADVGWCAVAGHRRPAFALAAALLALPAAGCAPVSYSDTPSGMRVGVAYDQGGPTDGLVNQAVQAGVFDFSTDDGGVGAVHELVAIPNEPPENRYDRLVILCQSGYDPVIAVGQGYVGPDPSNGPLARAARGCPGTRFAVVGDSGVSAPNVANLAFADAEGAYLMGVAAALSSTTHQVGFLANCHLPSVAAIESGYRAGVEAQRAGTRVDAKYLSEDPGTCPDVTDDRVARGAADDLYNEGVDVVYQVLGSASSGVFEAAKEHGGLAIGFGADQYKTADPAFRDAILTSQVDRVDVAVSDLLRGLAHDAYQAGNTAYGVGNGGIRYATSGPRAAALAPVLDGYRKKIANGTIVVPGSP